MVDPALGLEKEYLIETMKAEEIDCRPFFYPLSSLPAYDKQVQHAQERNCVSYRFSPNGVNLPSDLQMTQERVAQVCGALKSAIQNRVAAISSRV